jgi:hypothetical protein
LTTLLVATSAAAVGNAALDHYIVSDPNSGWLPVPTNSLNSYVNSIQRVEAAALTNTGYTTVIAAEGWHDPKSDKHLAIVTLIGITNNGSGSSSQNQAAIAAAASGAAPVCGATEAPPLTDQPLSSIPDSHQVVCNAVLGETVSALIFPKANVLAFVFSDTLGLSRLDAIAQDQYRALPSTDYAVTTGSSSIAWAIETGVGALIGVVLIAGAVVWWRIRRKRLSFATAHPLLGYGMSADYTLHPGETQSTEPSMPTAPPAGWYPDPADMSAKRYWTGTEWGPGGMGTNRSPDEV